MGLQRDFIDYDCGLDAGCVGVSASEVHLVNVAIEYAHGDCEHGFYSGGRTANTEVDIQTGAFRLPSNLAAMLAGTTSKGLESLSITGLAFELTDFVGAVSPHDTMPWWSGVVGIRMLRMTTVR